MVVRVTRIRRERLEVVLPHEQPRRRAHRLHVERARHMPRGRAQQRVHRRMIPDDVAVLLARGLKAGVKIRGRPARGHHADVRRQPGVEREPEFAPGHPGFRAGHFKMRHHAKRVDAGIGAAGTVQARLAGKQFGQRRLNFFLHAGTGLLHLPAFVARAVVGDGEFEFERPLGLGLLARWRLDGILIPSLQVAPAAASCRGNFATGSRRRSCPPSACAGRAARRPG